MARSFNQVTLVGRLTRDVEIKKTQSGKSIADFSLAVDKGNDEASFFDINAWDKTAELLEKFTQKGSKILVSGRLDQQTWDKDGQKRSKVVVVANEVQFMDSKQSDTPISDKARAEAKNVDLSDIPF